MVPPQRIVVIGRRSRRRRRVAHFGHETFIDMQPSGGVDNERVEHPALRPRERRARDQRRRLAAAGGEVLGLHLPARRSSCSSPRRPAHVGAGEQHALALGARQVSAGQLRRGGVLPAPCRPASSSTTGGCARSFQVVPDPPMSCTSSLVQNADDACPGVSSRAPSAPSALALTDSMNDFTTGSATSLQQCDAHLAQRLGTSRP